MTLDKDELSLITDEIGTFALELEFRVKDSLESFEEEDQDKLRNIHKQIDELNGKYRNKLE